MTTMTPFQGRSLPYERRCAGVPITWRRLLWVLEGWHVRLSRKGPLCGWSAWIFEWSPRRAPRQTAIVNQWSKETVATSCGTPRWISSRPGLRNCGHGPRLRRRRSRRQRGGDHVWTRRLQHPQRRHHVHRRRFHGHRRHVLLHPLVVERPSHVRFPVDHQGPASRTQPLQLLRRVDRPRFVRVAVGHRAAPEELGEVLGIAALEDASLRLPLCVRREGDGFISFL